MARLGIVFGLTLFGLSVLGMVMSNSKSPIQFYPMMIGIPVQLCGVIALNPHRRKHAMHVAAALASIGAVLGVAYAIFASVRWARGRLIDEHAFIMIASMAVICLVFTALCIMSFAESRRRKQPTG